jgi:hypothetical protein
LERGGGCGGRRRRFVDLFDRRVGQTTELDAHAAGGQRVGERLAPAKHGLFFGDVVGSVDQREAIESHFETYAAAILFDGA